MKCVYKLACGRVFYGSRAENEFGVARFPPLRYESNFRTAFTQLVRDEMKIQAVEANEMRISNPSYPIC